MLGKYPSILLNYFPKAHFQFSYILPCFEAHVILNEDFAKKAYHCFVKSMYGVYTSRYINKYPSDDPDYSRNSGLCKE